MATVGRDRGGASDTVDRAFAQDPALGDCLALARQQLCSPEPEAVSEGVPLLTGVFPGLADPAGQLWALFGVACWKGN
jgi:hypothetical protein